MLILASLIAGLVSFAQAGTDEGAKVRGFVHPQACIQGQPNNAKAGFETQGMLTFEEAVDGAIEILRRRGVGRLCICEVSWIASPASIYMVDAQGDYDFSGGHYTSFRLGIIDRTDEIGSHFPEEFIFIARGLDAAGQPLWFPPPGPDAGLEAREPCNRVLQPYEFLPDRERFETLASRFPPCPAAPREVLSAELLEACLRVDEERARLAVKEGADVNFRDHEGKSPLLLMLESQRMALAALLVEKGADVNAAARGSGKVIGGYTPLMAAIGHGDPGMTLLLLEHGADPNAVDEEGRSALWLSLENSQFEILDILLAHGADIDLKDKDGSTPLMKFAYLNRYKRLQWLLEHGAGTNVRDNEGRTALMLAASRGKTEAAHLLLQAGAAVDTRDSKGWTALAAATFAGQRNMVQFLIEAAKASVRIEDMEGTPLIVEVARRLGDDHADLMKTLVENGASADAGDKKGNTPLSEAAQWGNWEVVRVLVGLGADLNVYPAEQPPVITQAYWGKKFDLVKWLLNKGADPGKRFKGRDPFWIWPFVDKDREMVRRVLGHADSPDLKDERQATPLMWASRLGWSEIVVWLLDHGADANLASRYQKTALMEAAEKGHAEVAVLLLRYGADVQARTEKGWTPLMWATEKGHDEVVKKLLAAGADLGAVNNRGHNALDIARLNKRSKTFALLTAAILIRVFGRFFPLVSQIAPLGVAGCGRCFFRIFSKTKRRFSCILKNCLFSACCCCRWHWVQLFSRTRG